MVNDLVYKECIQSHNKALRAKNISRQFSWTKDMSRQFSSREDIQVSKSIGKIFNFTAIQRNSNQDSELTFFSSYMSFDVSFHTTCNLT